MKCTCTAISGRGGTPSSERERPGQMLFVDLASSNCKLIATDTPSGIYPSVGRRLVGGIGCAVNGSTGTHFSDYRLSGIDLLVLAHHKGCPSYWYFTQSTWAVKAGITRLAAGMARRSVYEMRLIWVAPMRHYFGQDIWRSGITVMTRTTPGTVSLAGFMIGLMVMLFVYYLADHMR